jgi:hypothetical protein
LSKSSPANARIASSDCQWRDGEEVSYVAVVTAQDGHIDVSLHRAVIGNCTLHEE